MSMIKSIRLSRSANSGEGGFDPWLESNKLCRLIQLNFQEPDLFNSSESILILLSQSEQPLSLAHEIH
jgi:hypothetical protein